METGQEAAKHWQKEQEWKCLFYSAAFILLPADAPMPTAGE